MRVFWRKTIVISCFLSLVAGATACKKEKKEKQEETYDPWEKVESIREQIRAPEFPDRDFLVTDYGAVDDGKTKGTEAFKKAIEACHESGGGRVIVPSGTFLTGAIHLKSNVNLHLEDGANILFSRDPQDYLPVVHTRWEGVEVMNYSALIYAYEQENIAVTGNGTLDGNANNEYWWPWVGVERFGWKEGLPRHNADRNRLLEQNHREVPVEERVYGEGHYLRPNFIQPYNCKNILISGVKLINSPMWNIHPVLCENVTIENVKVVSHGPNNDGCDPESCKNVLIKDCYFDTGDDCIAIKSGRNEDGRRIGIPAENHIIEGCIMKDGHGGVVIGSEISGGAKNIYGLNLEMDSPNLDRVLRIKTSSDRGGIIENVFVKNIKVGTYREAAVKCNMFYEKEGDHIPTIRNVRVENMEVKNGGKYGILIRAYPESPVENLQMINCTIDGVEVPVEADHIKGMHFENLKINGENITANP